MSRLVLDTNILISGFIWGGPPSRILDRIESGKDILFVSREILQEVSNVLGRKKLKLVLEKRNLSRGDLLVWIIQNSTIVLPQPMAGIVINDDPSDDKILACALSSGVDYIISGDHHLLGIKTHKSIRIVTATQYENR